MTREARTLFNEYVGERNGRKNEYLGKRAFEDVMRDIGFDFGRDKGEEVMAEMSVEGDGKVDEEAFVDWWLDNADDMHKDFKKYLLKRTDSDFDDDEGLFGSDE